MKLLHKSVVFIAVLTAAVFSACNMSPEYSGEFYSMDTVMTVRAYGRDSRSAVNAVEKEINRLDRLLSVQEKKSEIYRLNKNKLLSPSQETLKIIKRSKQISRITGGAFDITTQPLSALWGFYSGKDNAVPSEKQIEATKKAVGNEHILIDSGKIILDKNTCVDLGAIAKGYASKRAVAILRDCDISSAIISLGGNVRVIGCKPDGSDWIVGIANPDNPSEQIGALSVRDTAVITSGGYQRYFRENGKIYHHIINPHTGYPAESGLKSVTVVAEDDELADALSTALYVMGLEKSAELYRESGFSFGAVFVSDDGQTYVTDNIKDCYSGEDGFEVINK